MLNLEGKTVVITGSTGFLGKRLCKYLRSRNVYVVEIKHADCDLTDYSDTLYFFQNARPDYVIHAAALTGNVKFNSERPVEVLMSNTMMNSNVLRASHKTRAKKVVGILSSCAFSSDYEVLEPEHINVGVPHPSIRAFGDSKRYLWQLSQYYRSQYKMNCITVCPTGLYGDGCGFDLEKNKVLESLVKRIGDAYLDGEQTVKLWGNGKAKRQFIYVDDAAKLITFALETYEDGIRPMLFGTEDEYSIRVLAEMIAEKIGFDGDIVFDTTMPDGQLRKKLSTTQLRELYPAFQLTPFSVGLKRLIDSYFNTKKDTKCSNSALPLTA